MDFRTLGLFYNFECFLIFKFNRLVIGIRAVCVMSARPSQDASAVLKGAPLAPLRFLHAIHVSLHPNCIEGSGPLRATTEPHGLRRSKSTNAMITRSRSKRQRHDPLTAARVGHQKSEVMASVW